LRGVTNERAAASLVASVIQLASLLPSNGRVTVHKPLHNAMAVAQPHALASASSAAGERALVRELLFVFQGLDGDVLRFDAASRHFVLVPPADDVRFAALNPSVRALTMRLCEVGRSFRRVELFLRRADSSAGTGVVLQALAAGVRAELTAFKRAVAALEPQRKSLTLRRLYAWSLGGGGAAQVARRARFGGVKEARGGALLRLVAQYAAHGDADVRALVLSLVEQMSYPLRVMTRSWVLRGTVIDWHDEFFVYDRFLREPADARRRRAMAAVPRSLWADRFQLADAMLPPAELLSADDARLGAAARQVDQFLAERVRRPRRRWRRWRGDARRQRARSARDGARRRRHCESAAARRDVRAASARRRTLRRCATFSR
jgi:hypothetical protein